MHSKKIRAAASQRFGPVDILINNAAVLCSGCLEDIPIAQWERMIDVNLLAIVRSTKLFVPEMTARGSGHIVNTSSFRCTLPLFGRSHAICNYQGRDRLIHGITRVYVKPTASVVTLLLPGPVRTDIASRSQRFSPNFAFAVQDRSSSGSSRFKSARWFVDAIKNDIFFFPPTRRSRRRCRLRAADPEAFIAAQVAQMASE